jgi:hypothetical protein
MLRWIMNWLRGNKSSKDLDSDRRALDKCFHAFAERDYEDCQAQAMMLLKEHAGQRLGANEVDHTLMQLMLISCLRMGMTSFVEETGPSLLSTTTGRHRWFSTLLKLTLGQVEIAKSCSLAKNDEQRCQALYYAAARAVTQRERASAQRYLDACLAMNLQCLETTLARIEKCHV